jgi:hypothetical protein
MKKRHLKQRLKNLGVCKVCAPMLVYKPVAGATIAEINCPTCDRHITFDAASARAVDCLLLCLSNAGVCTNGMQGVFDGKVVRGSQCQCPKQHLSLEAKSVPEPATAVEV